MLTGRKIKIQMSTPVKNMKMMLLVLAIGAGLTVESAVKAESVEEYENGISCVRYKTSGETSKTLFFRYTIIDGITKEYNSLTVYKDGELLYVGGTEISFKSKAPILADLKQEYIKKIVKLFDKNNFLSLNIKQYPTMLDFNFKDSIIQYGITYYNSKEKNIAVSSSDTLSPELLNITSELNKLIDAIKRKEQDFRENVMVTYGQELYGFIGIYRFLTICKDGKVYFYGDNCDLKNKLNKDQFNRIVELFDKNNFFSLKDKYAPIGHRMSRHIIYYNYNSKVNNVEASYGKEDCPKEFLNIASELDTLAIELRKDINSGFVRLARQYTLKKWPFSSRIKLAEHSSNTPVDEDIYNYVKKGQESKEAVLYLEDDFVYWIKLSFNRDEKQGKIKECSIGIYGKSQPMQWPREIGIKLSDLPDKKAFIQGDTYQKIKQYMNYYFIEGELKEGNYAYEIYLINSNMRPEE